MKRVWLVLLLLAPLHVFSGTCLAEGDGLTWMLCDGMKWTLRVSEPDGTDLGEASAYITGDKSVRIYDTDYDLWRDVNCKVIRVEFSDETIEPREYAVCEWLWTLKLHVPDDTKPILREIFDFSHKGGDRSVNFVNASYDVRQCDFVDCGRQIGKRFELESADGADVTLVYGIGASSMTVSGNDSYPELVLGLEKLECPDGDIYYETIFTASSFSPDNAFLPDGKRWEYERVYPEFFETPPMEFVEEVTGDSCTGLLGCKEITIDDGIKAFRCSLGLRVFEYEEYYDRWLLKHDFSLDENTVCREYPWLCIDKADIVSVDDVDHRRIRIGEGEDAEYIVEGIGSSRRRSLFVVPEPTDGGKTMMTACYENGTLIFRYDNFEHGGSVGIKCIEASGDEYSETSDALYDLQGRRVVSPMSGEIYIRAGKIFRAGR